ncbi:hypothetical protein SAMN05660691_01009 [Rheinheimera pacifica]|uniref:Uncharacterized protein n=1 Tax=Rheinheimera pacifica TaxID=173990 RepID=A0A1H6KKN5_9GAMM|nr:hypothetical protein [Rheinheimera pacifica]SEH72112.1 hypothetical protein SAMN05660691_01009 [Rheinheimera pacifica]
MLNRLSRYFLRSVVLLAVLAVTLFFLITSKPVLSQRTIEASDVTTAQRVLSDTVQHLAQPNGNIKLIFDQQQLDALMNVASYALPQVEFSGVLNPFGVALHGQANLPLSWPRRGVQTSCLFMPSDRGFAIEHCKLGAIKLPGWIANPLLRLMVRTVIATPADQQLLALFARGELINSRLHFEAANASPIKLSLHPQIHRPFSFGSAQSAAADVEFYLQQLKQLQRQHKRERRLAFFAHKLLLVAINRADNSDLETEYTNALWALAVAFANKRFIYYANPDVKLHQVPNMPPMLLNGRRDLTLHFLYSAVLQMLGNTQLSQQIGNLKEIMDADRASGGSGFSFVDLAADRAGTHFAEHLASVTPQQLSQFNSLTFEQAIMPPTQDLPEGLTEQQLQQKLGGYNGAGFKQLEQEITRRINALKLYNSLPKPAVN